MKAVPSRPPTAYDPARPSLARLSEDLVGLILDRLASDSLKSLRQVALANTALYHLAKPRLHRCLTFRVGAGNNEAVRRQCKAINDSNLHSAVRQITVVDEARKKPPGVANQEEAIATIRDLLPTLTGLKELAYQGQCVPQSLLATLAKLPQVALSTKVVALGTHAADFTPPDSNLTRLRNCANLRAVDVKITYFGPNDCREMMRQLKELLLSCSRIARLSLDVSPPTGSSAAPGLQYCGLDFADGESLPALEELTLTEYPFGKVARSGGGITFQSQDYQLQENEVSHWAKHFDWSRLKRLQASNKDFVHELAPHLVNLEDFSCSGQWEVEEVESFCLTVPSALRSISAPCISVDSILRHSASIRELRIHTPETPWNNWKIQAASVDFLRVLRNRCGSLFDLSIDVARAHTWPYETFDLLSSFVNLKRLEIWFELGTRGQEIPVEPFVTASAAEHIFEYFRSKRAIPRSPLVRLTLHSGELNAPIPAGFLAPEAFWSQYNSTTIICQLSERDDEAAEGAYSTTCPRAAFERRQGPWKDSQRRLDLAPPGPTKTLLSRSKAKLSNILAHRTKAPVQDRQGVPLSRSNEATLVALEGPRPKSQWQAHY